MRGGERERSRRKRWRGYARGRGVRSGQGWERSRIEPENVGVAFLCIFISWICSRARARVAPVTYNLHLLLPLAPPFLPGYIPSTHSCWPRRSSDFLYPLCLDDGAHGARFSEVDSPRAQRVIGLLRTAIGLSAISVPRLISNLYVRARARLNRWRVALCTHIYV